jgi:hypothetical protein
MPPDGDHKPGTDPRGFAAEALARASAITAPAPWPQIDPSWATVQLLPPPPLPLHLFPAAWAQWITSAAEEASAPPDFVAAALLGTVGATIGNARWASPWPGWREPPTLNVACVGLPSSGKSPAIDRVAEPLGDLQAELNEDWAERQRAFRGAKVAAEERAAAWKSDVKEAIRLRHAPPEEPDSAAPPEPAARRRVISTDPTVERAARLSAENPRGLLLLRDELAGWITGMDRYSSAAGADRAFWLEAYGGRRWAPDRVKDEGNPIEVPHLTWGILGGIQPGRVSSLLTSGDDDGLSARFLYVWPASRRPTRPRGIGFPGYLLKLLRRLRSLPWDGPEPVTMPFTEEAACALQDWRERVADMEQTAAGLFLSWLGKTPGFLVRLALIFEHLAWRDGAGPPASIGLESVGRALGFLADYALPMAQRTFGDGLLPEAERDAHTLARWLLAKRPLPELVNARQLRRQEGAPAIPTAPRINAALEELSELGWVRAAPGRDGAGGRPRADWAVNPNLLAAS